MCKPENGSYAITEQGDLGLGLSPINESDVKKDDSEEKESKPEIV